MSWCQAWAETKHIYLSTVPQYISSICTCVLMVLWTQLHFYNALLFRSSAQFDLGSGLLEDEAKGSSPEIMVMFEL